MQIESPMPPLLREKTRAVQRKGKEKNVIVGELDKASKNLRTRVLRKNCLVQKGYSDTVQQAREGVSRWCACGESLHITEDLVDNRRGLNEKSKSNFASGVHPRPLPPLLRRIKRP